jgi:hypothetical protein
VAGNEANFFVRDITNGSLLPLRIRPGAPTSSLDIAASGNVGIGIAGPIAPLHIVRAGAVTALYTDKVPDPDVSWATGIPAGGGSFTIGIDGSSPVVTLRPFGDLDLLGSLSEAANLASVADVQEVSAADVLSKLASLPIRSWRFAGAPANARHLGPLSGDFAAAFALGGDASRIAPGDVAGVSLAAAQGLLAQTQALQAQNQGLSAKVQSTQKANKKLTKRVGGVARQLKKLRRAVRKLSK